MFAKENEQAQTLKTAAPSAVNFVTISHFYPTGFTCPGGHKLKMFTYTLSGF